MNELTHLSLFSGIGGLDLAAEWAGITTVGQCEWADYPTKVLEKHWPDVPKWRDIRTLTGEDFYERTGLRTVDVISGGFPCQPFSVAGKRRGKEDDRFLWPEMVRVIKELRPAWVVGENVAGIVKMALPDILSELETCGYRTRTFLVPACAVGARHRRYRVAIVGWNTNSRNRDEGQKRKMEERKNTKSAGICSGTSRERNLDVGYSEHNGLPSAKVTRGITETGRRQQERQETPCEFTGAGESGYSETLAYTESQYEGRLSFGTEQAVPGLVGSSKDVADSQVQGKRRLSIQPGKSQKESTDIEGRCEDIQYSNCTGCEEQYSSRQPDKQGFSCRRCDEGTICHPTGKRLPDRTSEPLERPEPESESKRSGGDVSDANNGSGSLRRNRKLPAIKETGERRGDFRGGTQEYESGQRRTAKSGLGRVADGIPDWVDGYWDIEPDIPRISTGILNRVSRLKCLGNAVVPQQFYPIFRAIAKIEQRKSRGE